MPSACHAAIASTVLGWGMLVGSAFHGVRAEQQANCGQSDVTVAYDDPAELYTGCRALVDVAGYFVGMGFDVAPRVSIRFADRASGPVATHGHFDAAQAQIVVYRSSDVSPWGLPWTAQLAASMLRHELIHMAIWKIIGGDPARLRREWHEFIAYAVQLDLMDPQLRKPLLIEQAQVRAFESNMEVNEFTLQMDPGLFAVAAYKTYLAKGAGRFVAQLLRAEIVPPNISHP